LLDAVPNVRIAALAASGIWVKLGTPQLCCGFGRERSNVATARKVGFDLQEGWQNPADLGICRARDTWRTRTPDQVRGRLHHARNSTRWMAYRSESKKESLDLLDRTPTYSYIRI